ncbi:MAG TPA: thioredoxin domain-containing protein [Vicinamibacterales bacterium]|nr:thioredoxin domain-containing protein [Vicinamibacterales bacterium]
MIVQQRLDALERLVNGTNEQLSELNKLLRSLLPPSATASFQAVDVNIAGSSWKGSPSAKLVLVEYSDFECPFCARHSQAAYRQIQQRFVDTGKLRYVFRHLPLENMHLNARKAAEAAECAGEQGKFWEMHDRLFANQKALSVADLGTYARAEQLNISDFEMCLNEGKMSAKVRDDLADAARVGLTGTPAFLIGVSEGDGVVRALRRIMGAQPYEVFELALNELLTQGDELESKSR